MPTPLYLIAHMEVEPDQVDYITPIFAAHARATQQKRGNRFMHLIREADHPERFSTMECWETMDDFKAHLNDAEHQGFQEKLQPVLAKEPEELRCELIA